MTGYDESVWNSPAARLLVIAPNWLGDGIMVMPALQVLRERLHPEAVLDVAAKSSQTGLWRMHGSVGEVFPMFGKTSRLFSEVRKLRERGYTHVFVIPNSFRSALGPFLARIPVRRGTAEQLRRGLITHPVRLNSDPDRHQQWENAEILLGDCPDSLPPPVLEAPEAARREAAELLSAGAGPFLGLIPGAARGPSKRWPGERFRAVAEGWISRTGGMAVWLGTGEDRELCEALAAGLPPEQTLNLAGKSSLELFCALLGRVDAVVANDSGGMHLAAALGTPVAGIFGLTNPRKTGPLHPRAAVLQHASRVSRAIARDSAAARAALEAVSAEEVLERVLAFPHETR